MSDNMKIDWRAALDMVRDLWVGDLPAGEYERHVRENTLPDPAHNAPKNDGQSLDM